MCDSKYIIISIVVSLFFCLFFIRNILLFPVGNEKMFKISEIIRLCAVTFLKKQYKIIFFVGIFLSFVVFLLFGFYCMMGFILGAFLSGLVGFIGMFISVKSNVRTANAVRISSLSKALDISFKAGSVTGLLVITLCLLGIFAYYCFLKTLSLDHKTLLNSLLALGFGASLISIFARLGGGIFTKGADIGADLVGKLEVGFSEDDYRNPVAIADNVGDNVGDCAGMAADLYETCCVTITASMILFDMLDKDNLGVNFILYPLIVISLSILSTIVGIFFVKLRGNNVIFSLYTGLLVTSLLSILLNFLFVYFCLGWNKIYIFSSFFIYGKNFFLCFLIGIFLTCFLVLVTEYYTSEKYFPVQDIARVSSRGHAPNIIQGLAFSMESTALPVLGVIFSILISYFISGIIGIAVAAIGMVSLAGFIVALDAYGPITDNAGGIAEMAMLGNEVRKKTDILDSVGNVTKAVTKGYAIGSAGLASLMLFFVYVEDLNFYYPNLNISFSLKDPFVISGLFFGGIIPYLFSSFSMKAVGNVASKVVDEARRQFLKMKHIKSDVFKPDYNSVINLLTKEAIKEMVFPSILPVILPIIWFSILCSFGKANAFTALGSMLLGTIVVGIFLAISMTSGGGSWDNAKKYIEAGNFGGKESRAYKAAITGDMVGDPYKDTAGPSINPLIKVSNIMSLFIVIFMSTF